MSEIVAGIIGILVVLITIQVERIRNAVDRAGREARHELERIRKAVEMMNAREEKAWQRSQNESGEPS